MSGNGPRVMYLILRYDLLSKLQWPLGALVTQAAHAATACLWTYKDDPDVIEYMDDIEHMRKVALKVDNEDELQQLHKKLDDAKIDHRVWIEDDMAVCIAVKPQPRMDEEEVVGMLEAIQLSPHLSETEFKKR